MQRIYVVLMAAIFMGGGCTAVQTGGGDSNATHDLLDIMKLSFKSVMRDPPFEHPGGPTSVVCFRMKGSGSGAAVKSDMESVFARLSSDLSKEGIKVVPECEFLQNRSYGGWIVEPGGAPAVFVQMGAPIFITPDSAEIEVEETRGGRWGGGYHCVLKKGPGARWRLNKCRGVFIS
jgi:hypothetical protein